MEIITKEAFGNAKSLFHALVGTLDTINNNRLTSSQLTSVEAWAKDISAIKSSDAHLKNVKEAMNAFTLPSLFSFYLVEKLISPSLKALTENNQYKLYQEVHELTSKHFASKTFQDSQDFSALETMIQKYLNEKNATLSKPPQNPAKATQEQVQSSIQTKALCDSTALKKFHDIYWKTKDFILPELAGQKLADSLVNGNAIRKAAIMLESIGKKYKNENVASWPKYWELQNEVVRNGMLFRKEKYPGFEFGAQISFANILKIPRGHLVVGYISEKIAESVIAELRSKGEPTNAIKTKLQAILKNLQEVAEKNKKATSEDMVDAISDVLIEMKAQYNFSNFDIYNWTFGLKHMLEPYDHYQLELGTRATPKPRLVIVGDSVPSGFDLEDLNQCWVSIFPELIQTNLKLNYEIVNCSIPGYTTTNGLEAVKGIGGEANSLIKLYAPDVVLCTLGGNDVYGKVCAESEELIDKIKDNMINFVETCKAKGVEKVIWGLGIPETFPDYAEWRLKLSQVMKEVAEETGIKAQMLSDEVLAKHNMSKDNLHPNQQGHHAIVRQTMITLKNELEGFAHAREAKIESPPTAITQLWNKKITPQGFQDTLELLRKKEEQYASLPKTLNPNLKAKKRPMGDSNAKTISKEEFIAYQFRTLPHFEQKILQENLNEYNTEVARNPRSRVTLRNKQINH